MSNHPVAFFEVLSPDHERAQKFYAELFGWSVDADPEMGGYGLVALIFAREISDPLTSLVKKIDAEIRSCRHVEPMGPRPVRPLRRSPLRRPAVPRRPGRLREVRRCER